MEGSASAPVLPNRKVLEDEDYVVPTGVFVRITHGAFSKDKGTYSSRINQIIRQAEKVPGPGKNMAHEDWDVAGGKKNHVIHEGNKFPKGSRDYKSCNKTPAPGSCEHKEFNMGKNITDHLSQRIRVVYGQMPKGKKRSFLDQAINHGAKIPWGTTSVGTSDAPGRNNKLDTQVKGSMNWSKEVTKNKSTKPPEKEIGPNHYSIDYKQQEEKQPCHAIPKAKAQNFLDKAVKDKLVCLRTKKEVPGPGTYNVHDYDDSKFSRGTKYLQLRGMSRSSVSGYF
jgi:hypothetical protein